MLKVATFTLVFVFLTLSVSAQSILGKWKTIDDVTGKEKGIVEIYERDGKYYGRITEIFDPNSRYKKCTLCCCEEKDKPLMGLVIVKDMEKDQDEYSGGEILDPKNGKYYDCVIKLVGNDKLKIRGYIGVTVLGRTQYWHRLKK